MRKYSVECGAKKPFTLRGTKLRKQVATACTNLNLSETDIVSLAEFIGHDSKIHKGIYRQTTI